jgi:hypothetical protein
MRKGGGGRPKAARNRRRRWYSFAKSGRFRNWHMSRRRLHSEKENKRKGKELLCDFSGVWTGVHV